MKKDILVLFSLILILLLIISGLNFQSVDSYYLSELESVSPDSKTVTVSIHCDGVLNYINILNKDVAKHIPDDGEILPETVCPIKDGETVFDILCRVARNNKIQIEYKSDLQSGAYVQGINYLYEYSCGVNSGWIFSVNGKFPGYSCSEYELQDGDSVEWIYNCAQGKILD